ncbi:MAG: hypothetical protein ACON47_01025 [Flavobacteriaceae bacterium]
MQLFFSLKYFLRSHTLILFLLFTTCSTHDDIPVNAWKDFFEHKEGNFPFILISVHGGDQKPQWIDDRKCQNAVVLQDQYTLGIAYQIKEELKKQGFEPYTVFAKIHRVKIDLNRSSDGALCEENETNRLWRAVHEQITSYSSAIQEKYGRGLLIDIHGHAHSIQRIELGYLLEGKDLRNLQKGSQMSNEKVSIKSLLHNHPSNQSLTDLLVGKQSLGTLLSQSGFPTVPSLSDQAPLEGDSYFSGGYITKTYGSQIKGRVDAIQVELNRYRLRDTPEDRKRFSEEFSKILLSYMNLHYRDAMD